VHEGLQLQHYSECIDDLPSAHARVQDVLYAHERMRVTADTSLYSNTRTHGDWPGTNSGREQHGESRPAAISLILIVPATLKRDECHENMRTTYQCMPVQRIEATEGRRTLELPESGPFQHLQPSPLAFRPQQSARPIVVSFCCQARAATTRCSGRASTRRVAGREHDALRLQALVASKNNYLWIIVWSGLCALSSPADSLDDHIDRHANRDAQVARTPGACRCTLERLLMQSLCSIFRIESIACF
jgi:hypothetical protein